MADWGGARQGTPGKAYPQRTDLNADRAPADSAQIATGGQQPNPNYVPPDSIPSPRDITAYPQEPITSGMALGAGPGPEALSTFGAMPESEARKTLRALMLVSDNPDLRRIMARMDMSGA